MKTPRKNSWETSVIAISFIAVWIYFAARIWAGRNEITISPAWQLLLLPSLILLIVIFARRLRRVLGSLRGEDGHEQEPTVWPPPNGRPKR
jgi:hypothetical protein